MTKRTMKLSEKIHRAETLGQCYDMTRAENEAWLKILQESGETFTALIVWQYLEGLSSLSEIV